MTKGMVISIKISVKIIGYRGSKFHIWIKEQRADASSYITD